ncbi:MAG: alpha-amylase family glycosyl hydrolase [Nitrospirota bacterium]|nr:alpha-amylase family glycosyl hydrolase [Nitrospirota bacterium]
MESDLLARKETHFVLWRPRNDDPPPHLVIGQFRGGNPPLFEEQQRHPLSRSVQHPDLWELPAAELGLVEGEVYEYWYEVENSNPDKASEATLLCTDPTAWTVDWRLLAPRLAPPFGEDDRDPASVVTWQNGKLFPCDPDGEAIDWAGDTAIAALPANNRLVIYELPTTWVRFEQLETRFQLAVGTFRDVTALIEPRTLPSPFSAISAFPHGQRHLQHLGVNALELLPPADSFVDREWGYATSNYFAADHDLGFPKGHSSPTPSVDLVELIKTCHRHRIRFFTDMVMAFSTRDPYENINFLDYHVQANVGDPEEFDQGRKRDGFGGDLFKYNFWTETYDPISGTRDNLVPARQLMLTHLVRWMRDFRIDGIRMDSIPNIGNWDFVKEFKDKAREIWQARGREQGLASGEADARFLVVGEDLAVPQELISQQRLDGQWNELFKRMVRAAILGQNDEQEPSFEWTVRKLIDCRLLQSEGNPIFTDGTQAINYVTSHDVEGFRNERLFNFLINNGVGDVARRMKLAFVCLLTAVGIPMIFAGEEFADQHDLLIGHPDKQVDPVNFERLGDPWRQQLANYVARLVKFRTSYDALAVNDTKFIHVDFNEAKRVLCWQRGQPGSDRQVVVVANLSDFMTPHASSGNAEYRVTNWPETPRGTKWREITQERDIPTEWVAREPIFPWEAKVYALVNE